MLLGMQRLIKREEGQDLIEYALMLAAISLAAVAGINTMAIALDNALIAIGLALVSAG
jgi:pilus assembly protein Flp/PilA